MASFDFEISSYVNRKGKQAIILRVIVDRQITRKSTGLLIDAKFSDPEKKINKNWDYTRQRVKPSYTNAAVINDALDTLYRNAEAAHASLVAKGESADSRAVVRKANASHDFYELMEGRIKDFEHAGSWGTVAKYQTVLTKLRAFAPVMPIEQMTPAFFNRLIKHLKSRGNADATIGANLKAVQATVRQAIKTGVFDGEDPFRLVTIPTGKPGKKDTLTREEVDNFYRLQLKGREALARDIFLFCYYCAGMRFGDAVRLTWADIKGDTITYRQGKTGAELQLPLVDQANLILSRYRRSGTATVFGLVDGYEGKRLADRIDQTNSNLRLPLRSAILKAGIPKHITMHCARHTFARIANEVSGRDVYSIQQSLGHSKMATTEIYLGEDPRAVADLMRRVYG